MNRRKFIRNLMAVPLASGSFLTGNPFNPAVKSAEAMGLTKTILLGNIANQTANNDTPGVQISQPGNFAGKTLVVIFQRGACDGLNTVVPFGDDEYYNLRPTIGISRPSGNASSALNLDGFLGLHPRLAPLHTLYQQGVLAVMPAVHYDNPSRSHFESQNLIESGMPQRMMDGWLNRHMGALKRESLVRAVSMGDELVHALRGSESVMTFNNISDFGASSFDSATIENLLNIYSDRVFDNDNLELVHQQGQIMLNNLETLAAVSEEDYTPENGAVYPDSSFGRQLTQIAQLIKSEVGLELATVNIGGWDTHANQGGAEGGQANRHADFASGIAALYNDVKNATNTDVVILTMTEFGRTARENGSRGTDHGNASSWFVVGNPVNGGMYGAGAQWPGLREDQLYQGRYLAKTIDYTDVFSEVLSRHLGNNALDSVFPGHRYNPIGFLS